MSEPNREAEISEAKAQGAHWDGSEWVYPRVKNKKKSMVKKMSLVDKLKKHIGESEHLRKHPLYIPGRLPKDEGGNLPPGYHDRNNQ